MRALTRAILRALDDGQRRPHPGRTGLYNLFNWQAELRYIGISNDPARRMGQHADTKLWWGEIDPSLTTVVWYPTRKQAERAEQHAIRTAGVPLYNIEHNPIRLRYAGPVARQSRMRPWLGTPLGLAVGSSAILVEHVVGWWRLSPGWLVVTLVVTGLSWALVRKGLR